MEDRERNAPALTYWIWYLLERDGTDIECPEEGVRDEDTAANATQPGAFHVEGIGSNRDEAGLGMNMAASAAVVLTISGSCVSRATKRSIVLGSLCWNRFTMHVQILYRTNSLTI